MSNAHPEEDLQVHESGFVVRGQHYDFQVVEHLEWHATHLTVRTNFRKTGERYDADLSIYVRSMHKPIRISAGNVWLGGFRDTARMCTTLRGMYVQLAEKTFSYRMVSYLDEIDKHGYFTYDGIRFHANGEIVRKNRAINIEDINLCINPEDGFELLAVEKEIGFLKSWFRKVVPLMRIFTNTDQDILYALLQSLYGRGWL